MKRYLLLWITTIGLLHSHAQQPIQREFNLESWVDEIFAVQDEDLNYEDLYESYLQLLSNPLDLNTVSAEQLQQLYLLNSSQISTFLQYRTQSGPILSEYELQSIDGFDREVILKLLPFIRVDDSQARLDASIVKRIISERNNYLLLRWSRVLEKQRGYQSETDSSQRYRGSPDYWYTRFRTSRPGDFSLGFTLEKDGGESMNNRPVGFDYFSFHAQVQNKSRLKNLILGDYQAQFGQGLTLGSVFGIGKNAEAITTIRRSNVGFAPYASLLENGFFRGLATSYSISKLWTAHLMGSIRKRDGNVTTDDRSEEGNSISSLGLTGLHRTPSEYENRLAIEERNVGSILQFKKSNLDAGALIHHTEFNLSLQPNTRIYNQFQFRGSSNTNLGIYLNWNYQNYAFFSEYSQSVHHGKAIIAGVLMSISRQLDLSFLYRKFDRNYYSFYSNALAESSTPQNETGFYSGWKYTINKIYSLSGYMDVFRFPWLRFRSYSPSVGNEWMIRFTMKPSRTTLLFLQYREETKSRNSSTETVAYENREGTKRNYWINLNYQALPHLRMRSRMQWSTFNFDNQFTSGMVIMQDVAWDVGKFTFTGRYALFDTDNFDNRLYAFEQDVWLAFSFPAYQGRGIRQYVLAEYRLNKKMAFWLRWSQTGYTDRDNIGSGGETIAGRQRNDVKFQAKITF